MKNKIINAGSFITEYILIIVFVYTGLIKLIKFNDWIEKINKIDIIREYHIIWFAYIIPFVEILLVILFFFNVTKKIAAFISIILMTIFSIYIYYKIYIAEDSNCPCGGIFSNLTLDKHLWVNLSLLLISILLFIIYRFQNKPIKNDIN